MELKRYILLSDRSILTKKEFESQRKVDLFYADRLFVNHSDNILDLVEVGDLVETKRDGVLEIIGENFYVRTGFNLYLIDITAIYKRQANGDYKRYEVEK